ncbi:hypothetical protein HG531_003155 [Fusarium graminearum]|nr:hypothetical protein HG531_003155 [Fusarium graminearum]
MLQENLKVNLESANRVSAEMVQNTKLAHASLLSTETEVHRGSVASEECSIIELLDPVAIGLAGVLFNLEIDTLTGQAFLMGKEGCAEHEQDTVKKAMDYLKPTGSAVPGSSKMSLVASLALLGLILENNIRDLEDLHGDAVALVLADGLEKTREKA